MKSKWKIPLFLSMAFILPAVNLSGLEAFEIGFGNSWHQSKGSYFLDLNPTLLEMSYYATFEFNKVFSLGLSYYSNSRDLRYYYKGDPLDPASWIGPCYKTETVDSGFINIGNAQMHVFDISLGLSKRISFFNLFFKVGPTVIAPGLVEPTSWELYDYPLSPSDTFEDLPDGWYETLEQYISDTRGWRPILGANIGAGAKLHLWYLTAWCAAVYRYTLGVPINDLLRNFELSFGAGLELYRKRQNK